MPTTKYSRFLEHTLPNLGVETKDLAVRKVYGGQIGHLVLSPASFVANEDGDGLTLEKLLDEAIDSSDDIGDNIEKEFLGALKASPHTFGLHERSLPKLSHYQSSYLRHSFRFDHSIAFGIKVPASKKRFDYENDEIEQFDVLMLGSTHASFSELDDCPERIFIGQEFREQVRELLDSSSNSFRLGQIGPSPIHPRIYVVDVSNEEFAQREIYIYDDDLYILVNLKLADCSVHAIYQDVLEVSEFDLDVFFTLSKMRSLLLDLHQAIHHKLQQTVDAYMHLGKNLFFINFGKLAGLRQDLLMIHKGSLAFELRLADHEVLRKKFLSKLENNIFFDEMDGYFREMTEPDVPMANALFKTLEYMEKSISSVDVAIRTIFAAVIGASIGVFVTLLVKL